MNFIICKLFCRRVVVTGIGMVTPIGNNMPENWKSMKDYKIGIRDLSEEIYSKDLPSNCKIGATILSSFDNKKYKTLGTDNLLTQITMSAAEEAIHDSGIIFDNKFIQNRTGVYVGSSLPSISNITESIEKSVKESYQHINKMLMLKMLTNLLASNISLKYQLKGPILSPTIACATSLNSIGESFKIIKYNEADVMVCGGSETSIHPLIFHSMNKLHTLYNTNKNFTPDKASRPFDNDRAGFILGEGSGIILIEELQHALKRGANIYCEIVSYATYGDAYHLTKPMQNGEGGYRTMSKCLYDGGITPYEVDLINCHATSTHVGDISEMNAIKYLFGNNKFYEKKYFNKMIENYDYQYNDNFDEERLKKLILNCNKTHFGHLLGAAGSVESIFTILAIKEGLILDNVNTNNPIDNILDFRQKGNKNFKYGMKNSFAFGGVNTSILYKNYKN